jgi:hypothetical protein
MIGTCKLCCKEQELKINTGFMEEKSLEELNEIS